jgi:hypothetical protein
MMTFVNVTIDRVHVAPGLNVSTHSPLDGVGGRVFTRVIEHTFEHRVILMMQEVLL